MLATLRVSALVVVGTITLAGCAYMEGMQGNEVATGSVPATPRIDPACVALTSQIESLRKDGVAEKIEKAAAKKYKMTQADLGKADQLTKANAEFQNRCSTLAPRTAAMATGAPAGPAIASTAQPAGKSALTGKTQ